MRRKFSDIIVGFWRRRELSKARADRGGIAIPEYQTRHQELLAQGSHAEGLQRRSEAVPDIDAREAFFRIFEDSEWREHELKTTTDTSLLVYNWLARRLDTEIHKALRNSLLNSWGEECLAGTASTPEKPIPPETWDKVEIVFDRSELPRTAAHWKGPTSRDFGKMAWVGVKFSKDQIFSRFPLIQRPIKIIFDETNPNRKFWSIEPIRDEAGQQTSGSFWEYRALIKNVSARTLRNVKVISEAMGPLPRRPEPSPFDMNRKHLIDLNPGDEALVVVQRWYNPPIVVGMACGVDMYGPIRVTASADDISPTMKLFHFDPERTPMIFE
jgi:hypothetical protein